MRKKLYIRIGIIFFIFVLVVTISIKIKYSLSPYEYIKYSLPFTKPEKALIENREVIYGLDRNAAPLTFVDENTGDKKGMLIDYVSSISVQTHNIIKLKPMDFMDISSEIRSGKVDLSDLFPSDERSRYLNFSQPIYTLTGVIVVASGSSGSENGTSTSTGNTNAKTGDPKSLGDMTDKRVAVVKGDYCEEYLAKENPHIKLLTTKNMADALNLVKTGKAYALAGDELVVNYYINKAGSENYFRRLDINLYNKEVTFAVRKGDDVLLSVLNKSILKMKKRNQLSLIWENWNGSSSLKMRDTAYFSGFMYTIYACLIMLMILYIINYLLKKKVNIAVADLKKEKSNLGNIIDSLDSFLIVVNDTGRIIQANKAAKTSKLIGNSEGKNISCLPVINTLYSRYMNGQRNVQHIDNNYYSFNIKDLGNNRLLVCSDVTANVMAQKKIRQNNKLIDVGKLTAGLAHEIRNPLGLIKNYEYIISKYIEDDVPRHALEVIDDSTIRINALIDNLLRFSRLDNDENSTLNITELIDSICALEKKNAENYNVALITEVEPNLNFVSNEESLKIILFNLINNGIESSYNVKNRQGMYVKITAILDSDTLVINVEDNGTGINEESTEEIFDAFFTTKETGTGLGLYIVQMEVRELMGEINVKSSPGSGSLFTVKIPEGKK